MLYNFNSFCVTNVLFSLQGDRSLWQHYLQFAWLGGPPIPLRNQHGRQQGRFMGMPVYGHAHMWVETKVHTYIAVSRKPLSLECPNY